MDKIAIRAILKKDYSLVHHLKDIKMIKNKQTLFLINSVLINHFLNEYDKDYNMHIVGDYIFIKTKNYLYPKYVIDNCMKCYRLIIE